LAVPVADAAAIEVAMDKSMADCMARKGFQYVPIDLATAIAMESSSDYEEIAGFPIDLKLEPSGYRPAPVEITRPFDNDAYAHSLGTAEQEAWSVAALGDFDDTVSVATPDGMSFEIPKQGCLAEARMQIFGSLDSAVIYEVGISAIDRQAAAITRSDQAIIDAVAAWSTCMKETTGYEFADFTEARAFVRENASMNGVIAPADAVCTARTGLADIYSETKARNLQATIDANIGLLETFSSQLTQVIANLTPE
jgi:hypothetical protein